jgi:hypothetical protein
MRINTLSIKKDLNISRIKRKGSVMLETFFKGTCKSIKIKEKANKGIWNAKHIEERVTKSPSAPSTKTLMEVRPYIVLHVNDPMTTSHSLHISDWFFQEISLYLGTDTPNRFFRWSSHT